MKRIRKFVMRLILSLLMKVDKSLYISLNINEDTPEEAILYSLVRLSDKSRRRHFIEGSRYGIPIDVLKRYVRPDVDVYIIAGLNDALSDIVFYMDDISQEYIDIIFDKRFNLRQSWSIANAISNDVDIELVKEFANPEFSGEKMNIVFDAICDGYCDIEWIRILANSKLDNNHLNIVFNNIDSDTDVELIKKLANPEFNKDQIDIIIKAIDCGFSDEEINEIAKPELDIDTMHDIFELISSNDCDDECEEQDPAVTNSDFNTAYRYNPYNFGGYGIAKPQASNSQPLNPDMVARLRQDNTSLYDPKIEQLDIWRAICTHKDPGNGQNALVQNPDGSFTCSICDKTFNFFEGTDEEIEAAIKTILDMFQTCKTIYLDAPNAMVEQYYQMSCLLKKFNLLTDSWRQQLMDDVDYASLYPQCIREFDIAPNTNNNDDTKVKVSIWGKLRKKITKFLLLVLKKIYK